jgi:flagellar motor switch protein FliN/FliY
MSSLQSVKVEISVVLGQSVIPMHQLLRMGRGAVIELNSHQDEPVTVMANNLPVAKGEIIIQGDRIAVTISEILRGPGFTTSPIVLNMLFSTKILHKEII